MRGTRIRSTTSSAFLLTLAAVALFSAPSLAAPSSAHRAVVVLLDGSGSLQQTDPDDLRTEAARLFVDTAPDGDKLHLLSFAGDATPLTTGFTEVNQQSRALLLDAAARAPRNGARTDHVAGLQAAAELFEQQTAQFREQYRPTVVLFTDGLLDPDPKVGTVESRRQQLPAVLERLRKAGAKVYGVSLGEGDPTLLEACAKGTGGASSVARAPHELLRSFWVLRERFSNAFSIVDQRAAKDPSSFEIPAWSNTVSVVVLRAAAPRAAKTKAGKGKQAEPVAACDVALEGPGAESCTKAAGRDYAVFRCAAPKAGSWKVSGRGCFGDVLAAATGDVHLELTLDPAQPVLGEPTRIAIAARAGTTPLAGFPFLTDALARATRGAEVLPLFDDGASGDLKTGDGAYSRSWRPSAAGEADLEATLGGATFELEARLPKLTVLPAALSISEPARKEISCFTAGGCKEQLELKNLLSGHALTVKPLRGFQFAPSVLPPGGSQSVEVIYEPPGSGVTVEVVAAVGIDGFERELKRVILVRRLTLWEFVLSLWFVFFPAVALVAGAIGVASKGPPPVRGAFAVTSTAPDGALTVLSTINLTDRRSTRITSMKLGFVTAFALESRKKGLLGGETFLVPQGVPLTMERRGASLTVTAARKLESGDRLTLSENDKTFVLTYR